MFQLPDDVRNYFRACFGCAIKRNKGSPEQLRADLQCATDHAYGDHTSCGSWCRYLNDPANYEHNGLPGGKDLKNLKLKSSLKNIFSRYILFCNQGPRTYCVSLFLAGKLHLNWRASRNFAIMKQNCKAGKGFEKKSCAFPNFGSFTSNFPFRKVECWIFELYLKVG